MENHSTNHSLPYYLKWKRMQNGISIEIAADCLGTCPEDIEGFEHGKIDLPPGAVYSMCLMYDRRCSLEARRIASAFERADERLKQTVRITLGLTPIESTPPPRSTMSFSVIHGAALTKNSAL